MSGFIVGEGGVVVLGKNKVVSWLDENEGRCRKIVKSRSIILVSIVIFGYLV